jgi:hypothetical protein
MSGPSGDSVTLVCNGSAVQITLYLRTYPVAGAPVALSFSPDVAGQRHTFTAKGREYKAERRELRVLVPDDATVDLLHRLLVWNGKEGSIKSTAREVYDLAKSRLSGFRVVRQVRVA